MKNIITRPKLLLVWVTITLLLYILLATAVMFSRQITLDGVRAFDFDLVVNSLTAFDEKTIDKDFKNLTDALTIDKGKTIFFPLALLYKNKCIENGNRTDSICSKYPNIDSFKTITKNIEPVKGFNKLRYHFNNGDTFFYKKFDDYVLIGQAGKYKYVNNMQALYIFIKDEWSRYFIYWDGEAGKYGNIRKTWEKTSGIFLIVISISILLLLMQSWYFKIQAKVYEKLKKENEHLSQEWDNLNNEYQQTVETLKNKENDLYKKEKHLKALGAEDNEIEKLTSLKEEIEKLKFDKNLKLKAIKKLEKKEISIEKNSALQLKKLNSEQKNEINSNLANELVNIKQLWRRDTDWGERKQIEKKITKEISGNPGLNIPFTATQAFIAFEENIVREQVKKLSSFDKDDTLGQNVHRLIENKLIPVGQEKKYWSIVSARNDWFHYGRLPSTSIMYHLLGILHDNKSEPLL